MGLSVYDASGTNDIFSSKIYVKKQWATYSDLWIDFRCLLLQAYSQLINISLFPAFCRDRRRAIPIFEFLNWTSWA